MSLYRVVPRVAIRKLPRPRLHLCVLFLGRFEVEWVNHDRLLRGIAVLRGGQEDRRRYTPVGDMSGCVDQLFDRLYCVGAWFLLFRDTGERKSVREGH